MHGTAVTGSSHCRRIVNGYRIHRRRPLYHYPESRRHDYMHLHYLYFVSRWSASRQSNAGIPPVASTATQSSPRVWNGKEHEAIGAGGDHSYAVAARRSRFARPRNGFRSGFSRRSRQSTCRFSRSTALRVCEAMIPKAPTSSPGACSSPRAATRCSTGNGGKRRLPGNRSSSASPPRGWSPSTAACAPRADTRPASKANALPEPLSTESGQTRPLPRTPRPHDRTRTTRRSRLDAQLPDHVATRTLELGAA